LNLSGLDLVCMLQAMQISRTDKKFSAWQEISCETGQTGKCLLFMCSEHIVQ